MPEVPSDQPFCSLVQAAAQGSARNKSASEERLSVIECTSSNTIRPFWTETAVLPPLWPSDGGPICPNVPRGPACSHGSASDEIPTMADNARYRELEGSRHCRARSV